MNRANNTIIADCNGVLCANCRLNVKKYTFFALNVHSLSSFFSTFTKILNNCPRLLTVLLFHLCVT